MWDECALKGFRLKLKRFGRLGSNYVDALLKTQGEKTRGEVRCKIGDMRNGRTAIFMLNNEEKRIIFVAWLSTMY